MQPSFDIVPVDFLAAAVTPQRANAQVFIDDECFLLTSAPAMELNGETRALGFNGSPALNDNYLLVESAIR
jgi:hypothetical protein